MRRLSYFFFSSRRRHTRCSRDWSSDVCSSDLLSTSHEAGIVEGRGEDELRMRLVGPGLEVSETEPESVFTLGYRVEGEAGLYRSEERRVGKECRCRWSLHP